MLVVVSPHLDDAVFSAGQLLAVHPGSLVVTVFAGRPDNAETTTTLHDAACGFANAAAACAARRAEDLDAVQDVLDCVVEHLPFVDYQYGTDRPTVDELATRIASLIRPNDVLVAPLGYPHHPDHALAAAACRQLGPGLVYAEQPYAYNAPEFTLADLGTMRRYYPASGALAVKREAVGRYRSQANVFDVEDLLRPEVFFAVPK